ncbi:MAG: cytochrome c3 family protein [Myxococcota bacterium]
MRRAVALALVPLLSIALGAGCLSPRSRHRLLTTFFDGVPPLERELPEGAAPPPRVASVTPSGSPRPAAPVLLLHDPYSDRACTECHDADRSNRLIDKVPELCWSCHDAEDYEGSVTHGPVAAGRCLACHDPHRSPNESLLVRAPASLCTGCHDRQTFPELERHRQREGADCLGCHDPHASDHDYMLDRPSGSS